jgi:hypothetical protein
MGRDSSVGIEAHSGLYGLWVESRWRTRFSAPVQTHPGASTALYTTRTSASFQPELDRTWFSVVRGLLPTNWACRCHVTSTDPTTKNGVCIYKLLLICFAKSGAPDFKNAVLLMKTRLHKQHCVNVAQIHYQGLLYFQNVTLSDGKGQT